MENLLIFFYILISISLILLVLLQQGKGSDIGSAFGGGSSNAMFGSSGSSNPLTKVTAIVSAIFLILSLSITYISRNSLEQGLDVDETVIEETGILPENNPE
jgi:preprotein translocase subunit SecG